MILPSYPCGIEKPRKPINLDKLVDQVLEEFLAAAFVLGFAAFEDVFLERLEIGLASLEVAPDATVPSAVAVLHGFCAKASANARSVAWKSHNYSACVC